MRRPWQLLADCLPCLPPARRARPHESRIRPDVLAALAERRKGRPRGRLGVPLLFDLQDANLASVALMVIDMQENFFPGLPVCHAVVPGINRMAGTLRELGGLVCWITSDVGPDALENWSVMYDNFFGQRTKEIKQKLRAGGIDFGFDYNPFTAAHGMDGPLWRDLDLQDTDWVVKKDRHSALSFGGEHQGRGPLEPPPHGLLGPRLRARGVRTLLVAGCATNCCCEASARDAMQQNFEVVMLADACAARTDADHNATLNNCVQFFGDVMLVDEAINALRRAAQR